MKFNIFILLLCCVLLTNFLFSIEKDVFIVSPPETPLLFPDSPVFFNHSFNEESDQDQYQSPKRFCSNNSNEDMFVEEPLGNDGVDPIKRLEERVNILFQIIAEIKNTIIVTNKELKKDIDEQVDSLNKEISYLKNIKQNKKKIYYQNINNSDNNVSTLPE